VLGLDKYQDPTFHKKSGTKRHLKTSFMNNNGHEIQQIVAQLKKLQLRESDPLQRLEVLNEENNIAVPVTSSRRAFAIGDRVGIKNPRPLQAKKGTIVKIGTNTNRITVLAKNGSKIVRAPINLVHID
jgi:hypothetical protein